MCPSISLSAHGSLAVHNSTIQVPLYLLPFLDKEPACRHTMARFEDDMEKLAAAVEDAIVEEEEEHKAGPDGRGVEESDEGYGIGMDLDGDDEDIEVIEDNELF